MRERSRRAENREMRNRSSSKQGNKGEMEIEKLNKLKEEPHLSGAYIRNLVKQLTSSRAKDPNSSRTQDGVCEDGFSQSLTKFTEGLSETPNEPHAPPQQPKKQVRRRLHTSRPYQERLLNMAEARREIVTALKFHRAAMKQANEQQQQQQQKSLQSLPQPSLEHEEEMKSLINPGIYPSNPNTFSNYVDKSSYSTFGYCPPPPPPTANPFSWPYSSIAPVPIVENLNLVLPNQSLGLNLNFQDFNNLDATLYQSRNNSSIYSSLSPSSSSHTVSSTEEIFPVVMSPGELPVTAGVAGSGLSSEDLHPAMDDDAIAEIRSIGEQHQMEWNDTLNLVTSAWWFKFLKTMEISPEERGEDDGYHPFDEFLAFPAWLNNANETCFLQQRLDDYCSGDYLKDPDLQCMDFGEIEGIDGEWLA